MRHGDEHALGVLRHLHRHDAVHRVEPLHRRHGVAPRDGPEGALELEPVLHDVVDLSEDRLGPVVAGVRHVLVEFLGVDPRGMIRDANRRRVAHPLVLRVQQHHLDVVDDDVGGLRGLGRREYSEIDGELRKLIRRSDRRKAGFQIDVWGLAGQRRWLVGHLPAGRCSAGQFGGPPERQRVGHVEVLRVTPLLEISTGLLHLEFRLIHAHGRLRRASGTLRLHLRLRPALHPGDFLRRHRSTSQNQPGDACTTEPPERYPQLRHERTSF